MSDHEDKYRRVSKAGEGNVSREGMANKSNAAEQSNRKVNTN